MKIYMILLVILACKLCSAQSPKYLVVQQKSFEKEKVISEGEFVIVVSYAGTKVKGPLQIKTDQLLVVKNKVVPLSSVAQIGVKNKRVMSIASLVVTNGMNFFIQGLNENLRTGWDSISSAHRASIPLLAVGLPFLFITKKYASEKWKFTVVIDPLNTWYP